MADMYLESAMLANGHYYHLEFVLAVKRPQSMEKAAIISALQRALRIDHVASYSIALSECEVWSC